MSRTENLSTILSTTEADDVAAIREELAALEPDAPAVTTATDSEATPVHLTHRDRELTASEAIAILDED